MNCHAQSHRLSEISLAIAVSFQCSNRTYLIPEWHAILYERSCRADTFPSQKANDEREGETGLGKGRPSLGSDVNYQIRARDLYYTELWIALPAKINNRYSSYSRLFIIRVIVSTATQYLIRWSLKYVWSLIISYISLKIRHLHYGTIC